MALKTQSYKYIISIQIKTLKNYLQCLRIMKDFIYFKQNIPNVKRTKNYPNMYQSCWYIRTAQYFVVKELALKSKQPISQRSFFGPVHVRKLGLERNSLC